MDYLCSKCNNKNILKIFPCIVCSRPISCYICDKCNTAINDIADTCSEKCINVLRGNGSVIPIKNADDKVLCMIDDFDDVLALTITNQNELNKELTEEDKKILKNNCECDSGTSHKPNIYPFKCILCKNNYTYDISCPYQYHEVDYVCCECDGILGDEDETETIMDKVYDVHAQIIEKNNN